MIKPIRSNILFKPFMVDGVTDGGILLPFKQESDKGEIVEVGNGTALKPMRLKKGDICFRVHKWGLPIQENGTTYYIMDEGAIIALT